MSIQILCLGLSLLSCAPAMAADATCSSAADLTCDLSNSVTQMDAAMDIGGGEPAVHLLQKGSVSKRSMPALLLLGDTAPRLPDTLTSATYETYVQEVQKSIQAPAVEYQHKGLDSESYWAKGLCMSSYFSALKKQVEDVVDNGIHGDIYETGTWRGGTSIFMLSVLRAYERLTGKEHPERQYFGFDSFQGFEAQGENEELDAYLAKEVYKAPLELVQASFDKFGLLDDRVHFVKGYFERTLPKFNAPNPIAILRLDGDLYSSTKVVLDRLYPHVQTAGWVIIDDYDWVPPIANGSSIKACRQATDEYRTRNQIKSPLISAVGGSLTPKSWKKE